LGSAAKAIDDRLILQVLKIPFATPWKSGKPGIGRKTRPPFQVVWNFRGLYRPVFRATIL
jgi:hypothetical protein